MKPDHTTPCACPGAGYCERWKFTTTKREHELCQSREDYRKLFASGRAPQHKREGRVIEPAPEPTAENFPCAHRLPLIEVVACNLCGLKGQPFDVLGCTLHDRCSIGRRHSKVKSCIGCGDRTVTESTTLNGAAK